MKRNSRQIGILIFLLVIVPGLILTYQLRQSKKSSVGPSSPAQVSEPNAVGQAPTTTLVSPQVPQAHLLKAALAKINKGKLWSFLRDGEGRINTITGLEIDTDNLSAESCLQVAQEIAEGLGVPQSQISDKVESPPENPVIKLLHYPQTIEGYEVEGSFLELIINKNTKKIFDVVSELKPALQLDKKMNFSFAQARSAIDKRFPDRIYEVREPPASPIIFPQKLNTGVLAWKIQVQFTKPVQESWYFYVSANDGNIIHEYHLMKY